MDCCFVYRNLFGNECVCVGWMDEDGGKSPKIGMFLEGNQLILI